MLDKVLCVDDDPITLLLIKAVLAKSCFCREIMKAKDGQEAIDLLKADTSTGVELILLDLNMPVKNGWDFLEEFDAELRSQHRDAKVVILSSTANPEDRERGKKHEVAIDFFSKPLTVEMLDDLKRSDAFRNRFPDSG